MKRTAHKLLGVILVLALCLGLFPGVLAAEDGKVSTVKVETAIEPIYDEVGDYGSATADEDAELYYAAVKRDGKWGYINIGTGEMVIEPKYDYAASFSKGFALAANVIGGFSDASGEWRATCQLYLLNSSGEETVLQRYSYNPYADEGEDKIRYFDYTVEAYTVDYTTGLYSDKNPINTDWGYYDGVVYTNLPYLPDGTPIVPKNIEALYPEADIMYIEMRGACVDGVIPMRIEYQINDYVNNSYDQGAVAFFMDLDGNIIRTFPKASFLDDKDKGVYIAYAPDASGKAVVEYGSWVSSYADDRYERTYDYGFGAMNDNGVWAVLPVYSMYRYFTSGLRFAQGLWTVSRDGEKWGAVNASGVEVIPLEYDALTSFRDDLAAAKKDGKWCYIDMYNNVYQIGTPEGGVADNIMIASQFGDNIAAVFDGERAYCIVNTPVNGVLPAVQGTEDLAMNLYFPDYEEYLETGTLGFIRTVGKYAAIERDGKWGFLKLTFELEGLNPFDDVHIGDYYYDPVQWAVENGVTKGVDDENTTFAPDGDCTRAQIATFLYRAAGEPEVASAAAFTDVPTGAYYADAVAWAVENGITTGTGDGTTFSPDQNCDRAQIVTFLYRAAGKPEVTASAAFTDVPAGEYYADAVAWAVENGITTGTGDGTTFAPASTCTRGQGVTFLYRAQAEK